MELHVLPEKTLKPKSVHGQQSTDGYGKLEWRFKWVIFNILKTSYTGFSVAFSTHL